MLFSVCSRNNNACSPHNKISAHCEDLVKWGFGQTLSKAKRKKKYQKSTQHRWVILWVSGNNSS